MLLPGFASSVLQKDGKDLWAVSHSTGTRALLILGHSLNDVIEQDWEAA